jgi:peptidoglycan/LPS O-acetylase OafA/YrhL
MNIAAYTAVRNNNFNLIRFLAAFTVLISHSFPIVYGTNANEPLISLALGVTLGELAVDVFFVTSGFLVFGSLMRSDDIFVFGNARVLRIFPGLFIMLVITVFLLGPLLSDLEFDEYFSHAETIEYFIFSATLLPGLFFGGHDWLPGLFTENAFKNTVNGSLWTLPIELSLYIGLAGMWLFSWIAKRRRFAFLILIILTATCMLFAASIFTQLVSMKWYGRLVEMAYMFFCGSTFYIFRDHIRLSHKTALFFASMLLSSACIGGKAFFIAYLVTLPYLLLYVAYVPKGFLLKFNLLGDYSYGIYIYAFPIQQSIASIFPNTTIVELIVRSGLLTLIMAISSWHFVESRAIKLKSNNKLHSMEPKKAVNS